MADMRVLTGTGRFVCLGLGSCIGVAALDSTSGVGGMLHIMLPESFAGRTEEKPGKFADTGLPVFMEKLERAGANRRRLRIALAGGSQMFKFGAEAGRLDVGTRNAAAVATMLKSLGLRAIAQDLGGSKGRTMTMDLETGEVRLRSVNEEERRLCNLSS